MWALRTFSCWFAVLLAAGLAQAQVAPRAIITGPKDARCGSLVVLDASESTGTGRLWLLAVSPEETSFLPVESGLKCIFASPVAGSYRFVLVVSGTNTNGGPAADMATHTIVLRAADVPPGPPSPPDPPSPPAHEGRRLIIVLRESSAKDSQTATLVLQLRTDETFLERLRAKNHPLPLVLDQDSPSPLVTRLRQEAGPSPLPLLFVVDYSAGAEGQTLLKAPLPATLDGVVDSLTKAGG
jgi:hypothetical protein